MRGAISERVEEGGRRRRRSADAPDRCVDVYGKLLFGQTSALESHMIEEGSKDWAHGGSTKEDAAERWLGSASRSLWTGGGPG